MGDMKKTMLPPGFQFDPTDEELIVHFLCRRAASLPCYPNIIPDLDFYAADPSELNEKVFSSKKEWYFFSRLKQNRFTQKGFWKEIGFSQPIFTTNGNEVGIKKYLVFNSINGDGAAPEAQKSWTMEEYHLLQSGILPKRTSQNIGENQDLSEWVLCRVHDQEILVDAQEKNYNDVPCSSDDGVELSYLDEIFFSMDDEQDEITFPS
ncbi:hypothetical protein CDL12_29242 [Handroanthus impetiginosus]|uniref:NAC domain-containing protein n=1 Tax=Handroanthus impetiginosus TaxID=429701 RepID=A0A2G9FZB5_9LAMI|nr:hypothetical protein CDL12_29242 [Handroanthus impetiginosus]